MALIFLSLAASALVHGVPLRAPAARMSVHSPGESSALYGLLDRLLRRAERSPSVRALTSRWLTMAPDALAENALVIGRNVVGDFEQGAELLDAAGPQLRAVCNVAVGYNNIDVPACRERGVVPNN